MAESIFKLGRAGTPEDPVVVGSRSSSKGYAQVTSTGLYTPTVPAGAEKVLIRPTGSVTIRDDGTDPTATVGYPVGVEGFAYDDPDSIDALRVYVMGGVVDLWWYA